MGSKLFLSVFLLAIIAGCVANKESRDTKDVDIMQNISISAEAFQDGGFIPDEYTCEGEDLSPALAWKGIPPESESLALIMDDPDCPGKTFVHWVIFNIPAKVQKLAKGMPRSETISDGSIQGMTDFGRAGYGGPCPPPGKPHRYYFKIYALDQKLSLGPGASKKQVEDAMKGHILAKGELIGKYGR